MVTFQFLGSRVCVASPIQALLGTLVSCVLVNGAGYISYKSDLTVAHSIYSVYRVTLLLPPA